MTTDEKSLVWVHVPKTGSTFCLALSRLQCPRRFTNETCDALDDVQLSQGCANVNGNKHASSIVEDEKLLKRTRRL